MKIEDIFVEEIKKNFPNLQDDDIRCMLNKNGITSACLRATKRIIANLLDKRLKKSSAKEAKT